MLNCVYSLMVFHRDNFNACITHTYTQWGTTIRERKSDIAAFIFITAVVRFGVVQPVSMRRL